MNHKSIITAFLLLVISYAFGQSSGERNFVFLLNDYSPRGSALAGNLVAFRGDVHTFFYNPAGINGIEGKEWSAAYVDHLLDFQGGMAVFSMMVPRVGRMAFHLVYFNYGTFQETDLFGEYTGRTFSASEMALGATLANTLGGNFEYGVTVKFIYSSLEHYTASALAVDGGLLYTAPFMEGLRMGISLSNLGIILNHYTDAQETMPFLMRVGVAKRLAHLPLTVSLAINDLTRATDGPAWKVLQRFSVGGEFDVNTNIRFRLGYQNDVNISTRPLSGRNFAGISAGVGILWRTFRFDYSYVSYGDLGSMNRLGITGRF